MTKLPTAVDVIVCWPRPCDFPAWRAFITANRPQFGDVFVVFTDMQGRDISGFVRDNFPGVTFIDSPPTGGRDWRDVAVNLALDRSTSDRVWFTEQDFICGSELLSQFRRPWGPLVGFDADDKRRLHPACIVVDRRLVDRTSRYFGPVPVDHFYTFGLEVCGMQEPILLKAGFRHYQAISEGQQLLGLGQRPRFRPEMFREWATDQLAAGVPLEPGWADLMRQEIAQP